MYPAILVRSDAGYQPGNPLLRNSDRVYLSENELDMPPAPAGVGVLEWLTRQMRERLPVDHAPLRLVVTDSHDRGYRCEVTTLVGHGGHPVGFRDGLQGREITEFRQRLSENTAQFNAVLLVPTGIGAAIGGHAGDATPVARLLASVCDTLVTHPNV